MRWLAATWCRKRPAAFDVEAAREEAISFAAYRVLSARFAPSPSAGEIQPLFDGLMDTLGYDRSNTSTAGELPAAVGNRIAAAVIAFGRRTARTRPTTTPTPPGTCRSIPPQDINATGINTVDPNRWQPLIINGLTQQFLTPQWGEVTPFALATISPTPAVLQRRPSRRNWAGLAMRSTRRRPSG